MTVKADGSHYILKHDDTYYLLHLNGKWAAAWDGKRWWPRPSDDDKWGAASNWITDYICKQ